MNYADIKQFDVANGPGIRVSLFVSGCRHHCKNCFNEVAWDFDYGKPFTKETIEQILEYLHPDYVRGLTLLGGEPLERVNQQGLIPLLQQVRQTYPGKTIWCFTGFDFEKDVLARMYQEWEETPLLLSMIDVLVDGKFEEDKKNLSLRFKGSSNQRTILVPQSLSAGQVILWDDSQPDY